MPEEELDFLFPRPPFLQMFIHHVFEGDRSLYRDTDINEKDWLVQMMENIMETTDLNQFSRPISQIQNSALPFKSFAHM